MKTRHTHRINHNGPADFDRQFEQWKQQHPKAVVVDVLLSQAEEPYILNGIYTAIVTYEE